MVLDVRRNHKAYYNIRDGENGGKEVRRRGRITYLSILYPTGISLYICGRELLIII